MCLGEELMVSVALACAGDWMQLPASSSQGTFKCMKTFARAQGGREGGLLSMRAVGNEPERDVVCV